MQQTFRMEQSDMLGYNALYTGSYRRFGEVCLHIGLQLQYSPVFTAFYPIRLESFNSAFVYKSAFQNFKSSIKSLIQQTEEIGVDVVLPGT